MDSLRYLNFTQTRGITLSCLSHSLEALVRSQGARIVSYRCAGIWEVCVCWFTKQPPGNVRIIRINHTLPVELVIAGFSRIPVPFF